MALLNDLKAACASLKSDELLSNHTTLAIGGPADYFAEVSSRRELIALQKAAQTHSLPVFLLGGGSNLLVSDQGVRGLVIHLEGEFRQCVFEKERVTVGSAVWMPTLAKQCAERGLAGVEALIGIPGTIGGGLVMNAGTREGSLGDVVETVEVLGAQGQVQTLARESLGFEYRRSKLEGGWILGARLRLKADERSSIMSRIDELLRYRTQTQPVGTSNCGSVFKNPPGQSAAQLVEKAGFKGMRCGGALVSERHANFIVNEKGATARDVRQLMQQIQQGVFEKFGVQLEPEIKLVGQW
jgi:UDP-N-acetylmuramate dehydrogenase